MHRNKKNKNKSRNRGKAHNREAAAVDRVQENGKENGKDIAEQQDGEDELPYAIRHSDVLGRYLVATRDLPPGELLMRVPPLVVGPCQGCAPLCLGCCAQLSADCAVCAACSWPLCSKSCAGVGQRYGHSAAECRLLATAALKPSNDTTMRYHAIVPLRCLLLKTELPAQWTELRKMEAHNELRRKLPHWATNQRETVDRIRVLWGMTQFDEDEIHTVCGILETNAFEVGQHGTTARALYPTAFYLAHDCVPNTCHTDDDDLALAIRTSRHVPKHAAITLSYAYTLQGTLKRREHLKESKFFDCGCARCADPTELGTYAGALKCPRCATGYVLSTQPLDACAVWRCANAACTGYEASAASVVSLMEKISKEVEAIDANDVAAYESCLDRYRKVLHVNHYHCLGIKHSLSQLYGKSKDFHINQLTERQLERKRDICRDLLRVFDALEPGYSRLRGMTLYELHAPIMILTRRALERQAIGKRELRARLAEVAAHLQEAGVILTFEPASSTEGAMGLAANEALANIKEWQQMLGVA